MGKIFGDVKGAKPLTERDNLQNKYNSSRANLLLVIAFTVINVVLIFLDSDSYFLFSLFVPYFLTFMGMLLTGKLPAEVYTEDWAGLEFLSDSVLVVTLVISAVIVVLYLLSWIFSKKQKVGWLIFALVMFAIDTVLMLFLQGIAADTIIDIVFHIWVLVSLFGGIRAYYKLKKLPEEEVSEQEEATAETDEEIVYENSPVLRMADLDAKAKILLETEKDGFVITYRRVKRVNELVINGNVYDEYEALVENAHNLSAVVGNRTIEAGYDGGFGSYIKMNGETIAKKVRLA